MPRSVPSRSFAPLLGGLVASLVACTKPPHAPPSASPEPAPIDRGHAPPSCPRCEPPRPPEPTELDAMTLAPRPEWADEYGGQAPDERFFDIAKLMAAHGLDRAAAVELQNHFRDLTRADPSGDRNAQYAEALRRARAGIFEDGRDRERLAKAPFIVVFDLDDTLYDQSIRGPGNAEACADFRATHPNGKTRAVMLNPGWTEAVHRIAALGGEVVLFSANVDEVCLANAAAWMLDGVPVLEHPAIAGFLTNSHLVLQPKSAGAPVPEPSKDLRILDPELSRTIIVDDNPKRLFQFRNVRVYRKFDADRYCSPTDDHTKRPDARGLAVVVDEIEDSVRYMKAHPGTSFATAYLPYTTLGRLAVDWLRQGNKGGERAAIAYLRAHPQLADEDF